MSEFEWVAAFIVAIGSTGRLTRLFTWDTYPPAAWLRAKWAALTNDGDWSVLMECGYCFGVWASGFVVGTAALSLHYLGDLHWSWWLFNAWMCVAYLGSILMAKDGDD